MAATRTSWTGWDMASLRCWSLGLVLEDGDGGVGSNDTGARRSLPKENHLANARSKVGAETTAQLAWILAPRLPEPEGVAQTDE